MTITATDNMTNKYLVYETDLDISIPYTKRKIPAGSHIQILKLNNMTDSPNALIKVLRVPIKGYHVGVSSVDDVWGIPLRSLIRYFK